MTDDRERSGQEGTGQPKAEGRKGRKQRAADGRMSLTGHFAELCASPSA